MADSTPESGSPLAVLNPAGRDAEQTFPDGAGDPRAPGHPPVNYHGYAACTRGAFYRDPRRVPEGSRVLLLLRKSPALALGAVRALRDRGCRIAISWKEAGIAQVATQLDDPAWLAALPELVRAVDAVVAPTPEMETLFRTLGASRVEWIPNPYPVDDPRWDFSVQPGARAGVFVGTREFGTPSRQHAAALCAVKAMGVRVTVVNPDGRAGLRRLAALDIPDLRVVPGPLPYADYLALMAAHRCVFQMDRSAVPGQVAGDALLCRIPCVGGDGAVDRAAHPETCGAGRTPGEVVEFLRQILAGWTPVMHPERVSFATVAARLDRFFP